MDVRKRGDLGRIDFGEAFDNVEDSVDYFGEAFDSVEDEGRKRKRKKGKTRNG